MLACGKCSPNQSRTSASQYLRGLSTTLVSRAAQRTLWSSPRYALLFEFGIVSKGCRGLSLVSRLRRGMHRVCSHLEPGWRPGVYLEFGRQVCLVRPVYKTRKDSSSSRESAGWVAQLRDRIERHEAGTPQFRLNLWRQAFHTPSYIKFFSVSCKNIFSGCRV